MMTASTGTTLKVLLLILGVSQLDLVIKDGLVLDPAKLLEENLKLFGP